MVLEQGHDPVADDDAEAERHRVDRREAIEAAIPEEGGVEPLAGMADRSLGRRCQQEKDDADQGDGDRAQVGRPEAGIALEVRHHRDRNAGREHRAASVEPLQERRAAARADVVAASDEREAGADADDAAAEERERGLGGRQGDRVSGRHQCETREGARARAEPVGSPPARNLHEHVHDELHGHEEPDRGQAHVVRMGELCRDRAEDRDVPAHRHADADPSHPVQAAEPTSRECAQPALRHDERCLLETGGERLLGQMRSSTTTGMRRSVRS